MADVVETPIEGRVAAVISVRELAINRGRQDGVWEGMVFAVLAESPLAVTDPESQKPLGELDRAKVRVKVSEVKDEFSIARTFETHQTGGAFWWPNVADLLGSPRTAHQTLRVEDSELPPALSEEERHVKRGDRVRQVMTITDTTDE